MLPPDKFQVSGLAMGDRERAGDTGTGHPVWRAQTTEEAGLRGLADVAMMLAADPELPTPDLVAVRCIVVERIDRTGRGEL